jgi:hypothetical protein
MDAPNIYMLTPEQIRQWHLRHWKIVDGTIEEIIPQLIVMYTRENGFTAESINDGYCFFFSGDLKTLFPEGEECNNWHESHVNDYNHVFFKLNGKYYDSETPNGVEDYHNLNSILSRVNADGTLKAKSEVA